MIDFSKGSDVQLTKNDQAVGVRLDDKANGVITAVLTWTAGVSGGADLDLFGWVIGKEGVTTPKSGRFNRLTKHPMKADVVSPRDLGSLRYRPFMEHGGDSRVPGREIIRLGNLAAQGYALFGVYQVFSNGVGSLASFDAAVTITDTEGNQTLVPLTHNHPNRYWATVALVDCTDSRGYIVRKAEQYSRPRVENSPELYGDGSIVMNKGPQYLNK